MLFFLKDNKKPFILGLSVPKVTAYDRLNKCLEFGKALWFYTSPSQREV